MTATRLTHPHIQCTKHLAGSRNVQEQSINVVMREKQACVTKVVVVFESRLSALVAKVTSALEL